MKLIYTETQTEASLGDAVVTRHGRTARVIGIYPPMDGAGLHPPGDSLTGSVHLKYDDTGYTHTYYPGVIFAVWSK